MRGLLIVAASALALAGCNGSSTDAGSIPSTHPATSHVGKLALSRAWSGGTVTTATVSRSVDQVSTSVRCSTSYGAQVCAAVIDYRSRFAPADARCLGRGLTHVRGMVDGKPVRLEVPIPRCLEGARLQRDAQVIERYLKL